MPFDADKHLRRSIRLQGYDYSQNGAYYVTICTHGRECLFGEIVDGTMRLNEWGSIAQAEWLQTPIIRPYVDLDEFVVMPNHFHGIIVLDEGLKPNKGRAWQRHAPTPPRQAAFGKPVAGSLSSIVGAFKAVVTRRINVLRDTPSGPLWQRNFYDEIIRNEKMLNNIREYVQFNPARWSEDNDNPSRW
jgi:putative transposase